MVSIYFIDRKTSCCCMCIWDFMENVAVTAAHLQNLKGPFACGSLGMHMRSTLTGRPSAKLSVQSASRFCAGDSDRTPCAATPTPNRHGNGFTKVEPPLGLFFSIKVLSLAWEMFTVLKCCLRIRSIQTAGEILSPSKSLGQSGKRYTSGYASVSNTIVSSRPIRSSVEHRAA